MQQENRFLCPLKIAEVNSLGAFIRVRNTSQHEDVDISGYTLRQLEGGHEFTFFRFPQNLVVPALQYVTVWASAAKTSHHPPSDLIARGQLYFRNNPTCITVLSRPSNQPVDIYSPVESAYVYKSTNPSVLQTQPVTRRLMTAEENPSIIKSPPSDTLPTSFRVPNISYSASHRPASSRKTPLRFRHSGLTHTDSSFISVTWNPARLNKNSPLVRLLAQKTARSKHGFDYLSYTPFTCDVRKV